MTPGEEGASERRGMPLPLPPAPPQNTPASSRATPRGWFQVSELGQREETDRLQS